MQFTCDMLTFKNINKIRFSDLKTSPSPQQLFQTCWMNKDEYCKKKVLTFYLNWQKKMPYESNIYKLFC